MQNCLFIGVDVALKGNQFCVMNFDQHIYFNLKFPNNPEGNDMVINKIKDIENKFFFEKSLLLWNLLACILFIRLVIFLLMST